MKNINVGIINHQIKNDVCDYLYPIGLYNSNPSLFNANYTLCKFNIDFMVTDQIPYEEIKNKISLDINSIS